MSCVCVLLTCSKSHCKLFIDNHKQVQLIDESSNGTWWNNQFVGRGKYRTLSTNDQIVLLHPNPPAGHPGHGHRLGQIPMRSAKCARAIGDPLRCVWFILMGVPNSVEQHGPLQV